MARGRSATLVGDLGKVAGMPLSLGICALVVTAYVMARDILNAWYPPSIAAACLGIGLAVGAGLHSAVGASGSLIVAVAVAWVGRVALRRRARCRIDGRAVAAEKRLAEWSARPDRDSGPVG